ncbi:MAG: hypothetical protein WC269_02795 [Candidatus Gracilibacteria bacterium]
MKNFKKLCAIFLSAVVLVVFSGCKAENGSGPATEPDVVLKEAMGNVYAIYAGGYELSFNGDMTANETPDAPDATTSASRNVNFDVVLSGIFDSQDKTSPKFTLGVDAKVKTGEEPVSLLGAELRLTKDYLYGVLSKAEGGPSEIPVEVTQLLGQWYKMPVPPDTFATSNLPTGKEEDLSPDQLKMKELIVKSSFFKDTKYVGTEDVNGVSSYHYTVVLDKDGIKKFLEEAALLSGSQLTDTDKQDMDDALSSTDLSGDIWVGADDMIIRKADGDLKMTLQDTGVLDMTFGIALENVNKVQTVEEPADAKDFDPSVLFGASSLLQGATTGQ